MGDVLHDPNSMWFWLLASLGATLLAALIIAWWRILRRLVRWVGTLIANAVKDWLRDVTHEEVTPRIEAVKAAVGTPNGNGAVVPMMEQVLENQRLASAWAVEHDAKDDDTRREVGVLRGQVARILGHLGLPPRADETL